MKLKVRLTVAEDRGDIVSWWEDWKTAVIPEMLLPQGYIVEDSGGNKICATYLYEEKNLGCSWMAWTVSNRSVSKEKRREGLDVLIKGIKKETMKINKSIVFTTSNLPSMSERLEDNDFMKGDQNVDHYFIFGGY